MIFYKPMEKINFSLVKNIRHRSSVGRASHSSKWRLLSVMVVEKLDELGETLPRNGDGNTEPILMKVHKSS